MWKHMQLLLKAMRLHGVQLSSLSLIMDVFETSACHTIYPQGHIRDITTLNCKILTQATPTRSYPPKEPILYTDTPSFHPPHPTYHATNGIRPHNPQVHPLPSSLPRSFYATWCSTLRASYTPFSLCRSISTST